MDNWSNRDTIALSQLLRTLRTLFLQASKIWYQNRCSLRETLKALINLNARQTNNNNNEIQLQCFALLSEIAINHNLKELHSEVEFVKFIKSLPSLLLKEKIQDNVIQTINTIVLRFRKSIENDLIKYQKEIIGKIFNFIHKKKRFFYFVTKNNFFNFEQYFRIYLNYKINL